MVSDQQQKEISFFFITTNLERDDGGRRRRERDFPSRDTRMKWNEFEFDLNKCVRMKWKIKFYAKGWIGDGGTREMEHVIWENIITSIFISIWWFLWFLTAVILISVLHVFILLFLSQTKQQTDGDSILSLRNGDSNRYQSHAAKILLKAIDLWKWNIFKSYFV